MNTLPNIPRASIVRMVEMAYNMSNNFEQTDVCWEFNTLCNVFWKLNFFILQMIIRWLMRKNEHIIFLYFILKGKTTDLLYDF